MGNIFGSPQDREYLECRPGDIEWALSVQAMELALGVAKPLGEILVERECVSREVLRAERAYIFLRDPETGELAMPVLNSCGEVIGIPESLNKRFGVFNADDGALLRPLAHQYAPALVSHCR